MKAEHNSNARALAVASVLALAAGCAVYQPDDEFYGDGAPHPGPTSARTIAELKERASASGVRIETREVAGYRLVGRVAAEVDVADADSEEDAELMAFFRLVLAAAEKNADAIVEVRRSVVQDGVAAHVAQPTAIATATADATSDALDRQTVRAYWRGEGTLSDRRLAGAFDRRGIAGRTIRFSGKAVGIPNTR